MRSFSNNLLLVIVGIIATGSISHVSVNLRFLFNTLITSLNFTDSDNSTSTNTTSNATIFIPKLYTVELDATPGTTDAANQQASFLSTTNQ